MKKAYVRPESKLFAMSFTENIAMQSGVADGGNIRWERVLGHPGLYYSGCIYAEVVEAPDIKSYKEEYEECWPKVMASRDWIAIDQFFNCSMH